MERLHKVQIWRNITGRTFDKAAELAGTYDMQNSVDPKDAKAGTKKAVIEKTAAIGHLVHGAGNIESTGIESNVSGTSLKKLPQSAGLRPRVDIAGKEPPKLLQEKKAQYYALPSRDLYPLDSYAQVKEAARYFLEHQKFIAPPEKHEYCSNLVKRASTLGIYVDPDVEKYGSGTYAPDEDIEVCLDIRRSNLLDESQVGLLNKLAEIRLAMHPEDFAITLGEFDKLAALDYHYGEVPDPYYTTFGKTAKAQESKEDPEESIIVGNEYLTQRKLIDFSKRMNESIHQRFGHDFQKKFTANPRSVFDALPRDQKLVIMRMANTSDSQRTCASTS